MHRTFSSFKTQNVDELERIVCYKLSFFCVLLINYIFYFRLGFTKNLKKGTGIFIAILKNLKKACKENADPTEYRKTVVESSDLDLSTITDDLNYLRNAAIPEQLSQKKAKLVSTFTARQQLIKSKKESINLKQEFPYCFAAPQLVRNIEIVKNKFIYAVNFLISFEFKQI